VRIAQIAPLYEAVPPTLYGGAERVVSFLTEELVALGPHLLAVTADPLRAGGAAFPAIRVAALMPEVVGRLFVLRPPLNDQCKVGIDGHPADAGVGLCLPNFRGSMHRSPRRGVTSPQTCRKSVDRGCRVTSCPLPPARRLRLGASRRSGAITQGRHRNGDGRS
jgi:hypothetical protein